MKSVQRHSPFRSVIEMAGPNSGFHYLVWLPAVRFWGLVAVTTGNLFGLPWGISVPQLFQSKKPDFEILFSAYVSILKGPGRKAFRGESKTAKP